MKKKLALFGVGIVGSGLLSLGSVGAAQAASLYDNVNFSGFMETRTSGNVTSNFSDRTTSFTNSGSEKYCENKGCVGRTVTLSGSYNDLRPVTTGLGAFENWNDRISALG
ncbi:hypothetical protein [Leifsonia xyli]|uniref:hypothetical protein n=1 Tax=Leifsonia xyli TaxID=1575 RepID=UPI0011853E67|nr:hypothetical protein [Leifsonia xyli]